MTRYSIAAKICVTFSTLAILTLTASEARANTSSVRQEVEVWGDRITADRISDALNTDPIYYFVHVDVRVHHGVAALSGFVWDTPALYRALEIAAQVPGVRRVADQMELEREGTEG